MTFEQIFGRMLVAAGLKEAPRKRQRVAKEEKKPSMQIQTLIFDKDGFDADKAKKWAEDHNFKSAKVDETGSSFRLRQANPGRFKTMRTITLTDGVKAVVGKSDPSSSDVHVDSTDWSAKKRKKPAPSKMMIEKQGGGIMVALYVPPAFAKTLEVENGEKPEDMHITLVYIPGVGEDQKMFDKIAAAVKPVAERFDAIEVMVDGIEKFTASQQTDWKDVYYACPYASDLMILQDQIAKALAFAGVEVSRKHSFVPHITLKYADVGSAAPEKEPKGSFVVSQLSVASKTLPVKHMGLNALVPEEAKRPHPYEIAKQDEMSPEQLRAKASDLIVLPEEIEGTNCANCKYFSYDDSQDVAVCVNPEVDQPVDDKMCCALWDAEGAERVWELQALEKSYDQQCDPDFDEDCEDVDKLLEGLGLKRQAPAEDVRMALAAFGSVGAPAAGKPKRLPPDNTGAGSVEMALKALGVEDKTIPIFKADKTKQIVYGVVLEPDTVDAQEDVMMADDIEEAAHKYLAESRNVGSGHTKPIKAVPVESYIAPVDFQGEGQYGNQIVKKGSWVLGVKVLDPKEWAKVEKGEYTGFSVGGVGERIQL